jgi:hypothetical protein
VDRLTSWGRSRQMEAWDSRDGTFHQPVVGGGSDGSPAASASALSAGAMIGARHVNAMPEIVATNPAPGEAFRRGQRCLLSVDARKGVGGRKQPGGTDKPAAP